jgi:hypothetical protein
LCWLTSLQVCKNRSIARENKGFHYHALCETKNKTVRVLCVACSCTAHTCALVAQHREARHTPDATREMLVKRCLAFRVVSSRTPTEHWLRAMSHFCRTTAVVSTVRRSGNKAHGEERVKRKIRQQDAPRLCGPRHSSGSSGPLGKNNVCASSFHRVGTGALAV